jgi:hypothetical protein
VHDLKRVIDLVRSTVRSRTMTMIVLGANAFVPRPQTTSRQQRQR